MDNEKIDWLESCIGKITARPFVVEYLPAHRASWLSMWGDQDREAYFRVTFRGLESMVQIYPARVELKDDEHIRARLKFVVDADKAECAEAERVEN
jgi:hypothetical protein